MGQRRDGPRDQNPQPTIQFVCDVYHANPAGHPAEPALAGVVGAVAAEAEVLGHVPS